MPKNLQKYTLFLAGALCAFLQFRGYGWEYIDSDLLPESAGDKIIYEEGDSTRADALARFGVACLSILRTGRFSDRAVDHLAKALENDPGSVELLKLFLEACQAKEKFQKKAEVLSYVAGKKPEAVFLNLEAAKALSAVGKRDEAVLVLERCLKALEERKDGGEKAASVRGRIRVIIQLADLYAQTERYLDGHRLLTSAARNPDYMDDFFLRRAAVVYYSLKAARPEKKGVGDDAKADKNGREKEQADLFLTGLERELDAVESICSETNLSISSIGPVLKTLRKFRMDARIEKLILFQLLFAPRDRHLRILLATQYSEAGKHMSAHRIWKRLCEKVPDEAEFFFEAGRAAMLAQRYETAASFTEKSLKLKPDNYQAVYQLAGILFEQGEYDRAMTQLDRLPESPHTRRFKALTLRYQDRHREAMEMMLGVEKLLEQPEEPGALDKSYYLSCAVFCENAGRRDLAEQKLSASLEKEPENPELANFLGYLWADENKNLDEAERLIRLAIEEEPGNSAYLDSMAWVLYRKKEFSEAEKYIRFSLKEEGFLPNAVISDHAGDIFFAVGKTAEAIEMWEKTLQRYIATEEVDREKGRENIRNARETDS